ncbi:MAG: hypothetical protein LBJ14_03135 [Desulfarculales bacterium]|nr:hypothetical protein [Desulfarculales bacterium]
MKCPQLILLLLLTASSGCAVAGMATGLGTGLGSSSGTVQANSRYFEEVYMSEGEGPSLYRYAEDLLYQGRYYEALNAYYNCELAAYSNNVREAARARRMWLQEVVVAYENGASPPPPPVVKPTDSGAPRVTPKAIYDGPYAGGGHRDAVSVVAVSPRGSDPASHYEQNGGDYNIYGYSHYPGDIGPEEINVPSPAPRLPKNEFHWYNPFSWRQP